LLTVHVAHFRLMIIDTFPVLRRTTTHSTKQKIK
jgi:hypothetical protein